MLTKLFTELAVPLAITYGLSFVLDWGRHQRETTGSDAIMRNAAVIFSMQLSKSIVAGTICIDSHGGRLFSVVFIGIACLIGATLNSFFPPRKVFAWLSSLLGGRV